MIALTTPFGLNGKTVIVTGGSSGIGRVTAIVCSRLGGRVVLLGRDESRLRSVHSSLEGDAKHMWYSADLTDSQKAPELVETIVSDVGRVQGVVHCAGISTTLPLRVLAEKHLDNFFSTNVSSAILLTRLLTRPSIMGDGGSVVFLSSVMGMVGEAGKTLYSLTKGALIAGAKSLAVELAEKRIRVNCISPGVVETPMSQQAVYSRDEVSRRRIESYHPLGLGKPEDVANAIIFLLSDASRWITGTNLVVDGGYTAR